MIWKRVLKLGYRNESIKDVALPPKVIELNFAGREMMEHLRYDDPLLDEIVGGTALYNQAAVTAAMQSYDYNNPTQGVTNFQHPSTVYNDGTTMSSAWIPSADLYVFENYDASNGKPIRVTFDFNGNGYDPNNMGGDLVTQVLTPYGAEQVNDALQDGSADWVENPEQWIEEYAAGGGKVIYG